MPGHGGCPNFEPVSLHLFTLQIYLLLSPDWNELFCIALMLAVMGGVE